MNNRLAVLDGWRGTSILFVLASHLLPLGPKSWHLNETAGPVGMALFFTLSGFLITRFLLGPHGIADFLVRRFFRIVPLAWIGSAVCLVASGSSAYASHFLFFANTAGTLTDMGAHLWSLCIEVQFYVFMALLVAAFGRRSLMVIPVLCLAVTLHRVWMDAHADINTLLRIDEILAGCILALAFEGRLGASQWLGRLNPYALLALFVVCCHPSSGFMNYLRPYAAALLVGSTLYRPRPLLDKLLNTRSLAYIAATSFALYVIHHILMFTWLGEGPTLIKYAKRPLLFAAAFALAHLSTFYMEARFIECGRRLAALMASRRAAGV